MRHDKNKRILITLYAAVASMVLLTGFTSMAAEAGQDTGIADIHSSLFERDFSGTAGEVCGEALSDTKEQAQDAHEEYLAKIEEERKAAEEAERLAREQEEAERAAERRLLAALIFCEAGNQPYEGQVAVGAVVMNRVKSGSYPDTIEEVIYQSGQFTPAMTGWLDSVLADGGYTDSAMQAAEDALAGSNPVGDCLYFSTGGYGLQIGDHYFH